MSNDQTRELPSLASTEDVAALTALINDAFRVESKFKKGDRIDEPGVKEKMASGSIYKLVSEGAVVACVYVKDQERREIVRWLTAQGPATSDC